MKKLSSLIPGLAAALAVMLAAILATQAAGKYGPWKDIPLSPIMVALILSLVIRIFFQLPQSLRAGIAFGQKGLLRLGIMLMGIRLSIFTVLEIGLLALGLVILCITAALAVTIFIARQLGISERLGILIAAGTSICGISAIVATSPVIDAREEESAYAVGTITIFGILATLTYPYLTELVLNLPVSRAGFFLGTAIHDTSQVTAAALLYDQLWSLVSPAGLTGADIAITTKLVRNTFMIAVIPLLGFWFRRKNGLPAVSSKIKLLNYIPLFVLGYIAMGIARTLGDYFFGIDNADWTNIWQNIKSIATYLIIFAITCVGLNTDIRQLSNLGYKPFVCGLAAALTVGLVSWLLVSQFGHQLTM